MNKSICDLTTGVVSIIALTNAEKIERQLLIESFKNLAYSQLPFKIRIERNERLRATDWRMLVDVANGDIWKVYRQALRDIPAQPGFPENVVWPIEP